MTAPGPAVRTVLDTLAGVSPDPGPPLPMLRELIASTSRRSPGTDPIIDLDPLAPEAVDLVLTSDRRVDVVEEAMGTRGWPWSPRQLTVRRRSIADSDPAATTSFRPEPISSMIRSPEVSMPIGGVWTSTEVARGVTSWSTWMEVGGASSSFVGPTYRWSLTAREDLATHTIGGAADWVRFAERFPGPAHQYGCTVDWAEAARHCDAVHVTLRGAVATQGIVFLTAAGPLAPPYFDVESTLWSGWPFSRVDVLSAAGDPVER